MTFAARPLLVVAVGGNAISPSGSGLTYRQERSAVAAAAAELSTLSRRHGYRLLVVHGNGPQVGRLLLPGAGDDDLDIHVAQTQGELGYLLVSTLQAAGVAPVACILTRAEVDPADPAFAHPAKAIGPLLASRPDGAAVPVPGGRGWRRAVASPAPRAVPETAAIARLLAAGHVVAGGGGGIPVTAQGEPVSAVVDKDRLAALLAVSLDAAGLLIGTDVAGVFENFDTAEPRLLRHLAAGNALQQARAGVYPAGSMGPKVESAAHFAIRTGRPAMIAALGSLAGALAGTAGTRIQ